MDAVPSIAKIDQFRLTEKLVRSFVSSLTRSSSNNKHFNHQQHINQFNAHDIIDIRQRSSFDPRIIEISNERDNSVVSFVKIENLPDGLCFIPKALNLDDQIEWARTALENYSRVEHTNLTNLSKLRDNELVEPGECLRPETDPHSNSEALMNKQPSPHISSNLWKESLKSGDTTFRDFFTLRWSSLGKILIFLVSCYVDKRLLH